MKVDRQLQVKGTAAFCQHNELEDIKSYGDTVMGRRCCACGVIWGKAWCTGCEEERYCLLVSADGSERYCTEDCRRQTIAARAKEKGIKAVRRRSGVRR